MTLSLLEQSLLAGLVVGIIAALVALGFTLVLGILGIVNFAHGNQLMIAMYLALYGSQALGLNPFASSLIITPVMFVLGLGIYAVMMRWLIDKPHSTHVAGTIGLMLLLENVVNLVVGGTPKTVDAGFSSASIAIHDTYLPVSRVLAAGLAAVAVLALYLFLRRTDLGLATRACADNFQGARVTGLRINRVFAVSFALSVAAAGLAGAALSSHQTMTPFVGHAYLSTAFAVVILAGAGNILGTIVSGIFVGLVQALTQTLFDASIGTAVLFVLIMVTLLVRPQGLFAR
ncbi:MAG: hypothetical protein GEV10_26585 [Streptosporangiales bacterium]|nr:hypothetical protein [Streptosporangiales bacterium]